MEKAENELRHGTRRHSTVKELGNVEIGESYSTDTLPFNVSKHKDKKDIDIKERT